MLGWLRRRRLRQWEEEAETLRTAGAALRATTRRIWLEPGYPLLEPVNADVEQRLQALVWSSDTLPIGHATRKALRDWAFDRFDALYQAWDADPAVNAEAEQAFEADGLALVRRIRSELGPEWQVGLYSVKLDAPVFDLDAMPEDEWLYRFDHATPEGG